MVLKCLSRNITVNLHKMWWRKNKKLESYLLVKQIFVYTSVNKFEKKFTEWIFYQTVLCPQTIFPSNLQGEPIPEYFITEIRITSNNIFYYTLFLNVLLLKTKEMEMLH